MRSIRGKDQGRRVRDGQNSPGDSATPRSRTPHLTGWSVDQTATAGSGSGYDGKSQRIGKGSNS